MQTITDSHAGPTHRFRSPTGTWWVAEPATREAWVSLLAEVPDAIHTQTPEWVDALLRVEGGFNATRLYRSDDGRQLVLPLVRHGLTARVSRYRSLPYGWGNPGVLSPDPLAPDTARVVLEDLARLHSTQVALRTDPAQQEVWHDAAPPGFGSVVHTTHTLDLLRGPIHHWDVTLSGATRTKIRKAEKLGVEVMWASAGQELATFYSMYERWTLERSERRGIPAALALAMARRRDPLRKFEAVAAALGSRFLVWVASLGRRTLAVNLQLIHGNHSTYWRGYGLRGDAGRTRATYLLQRRMIEEACARGCRWHHMGESGGVPSLEQFKETFGAVRETHTEFYRDRLPIVKSAQAFDAMRSWVEGALVKARRLR